MVTTHSGLGSALFRVELEGGPVFTELSRPEGLRSVVVDDRLGMVGVAELTVVGREHQWGAFRPDTPVTIQVLGGQPQSPLFHGTITGLRHTVRRGQQSLTVIASSVLHHLARSRHTRAFGDPDQHLRLTDAAIAAEVIRGHGLTPKVDGTTFARPYVVQRGETDLAFLQRLAHRNGWVVTTEGTRTVVCGQRRSQPEILVDRNADVLIDLDYTWSPGAVPEQLTVSGWNYLEKEPVTAVVPSAGHAQEGPHVADAVAEQPSAARDHASGELLRRSHELVRGQARIVGNGLVRAHRVVRFAGLPDGFNPQGYVVAARHRIQDGTYVTDLRFTSDVPPGGRP